MFRALPPRRRELSLSILIAVAAAAISFVLPVVAGPALLPSAGASDAPLTGLEVRSELRASGTGPYTSYLGPSATRLFVAGQDGQTLSLGTSTNDPSVIWFHANGWKQTGGGVEGWSVELPRNIGPGTYTTSRFGTVAGAPTVLDVNGAARGCNTVPGVLTVHEAEWNDGQPVRLAADFAVHCEDETTPATFGSLRWNSTVSFGRAVDNDPTPLTQMSISNGVEVGQSAQIVVRLTGKTPDPVTFGAASLLGGTRNDKDWALTDDGCAGKTLGSGASCEIVVTLTPEERGRKTIAVRVPDGSAQPMPIILQKQAIPQPGRPENFGANGLLGRATLQWGPPASSPQSVVGYALDEADPAAPGGWRQLTRIDDPQASDWTIGELAPGSVHTYSARSIYSDGTFGPRSRIWTTTIARRELAWAGYGLQFQAVDPQGPALGVRADTRDADRVAFSPSGRYIALVDTDGLSYGAATVQDLYGRGPLTGVSARADGVEDFDATFTDENTLVVTSGPFDDPSRRWLKLARLVTSTLGRVTDGETVIPNSEGLTDPAVAVAGAKPVLVAAAVDGSGLVRLTSDGARTPIAGTAGAHDPAVDAQGRIAFVVRTADGADELRTRSTDGTVSGVPLPGPSGEGPLRVLDPSFSPTGELVASIGREPSPGYLTGRDAWLLPLDGADPVNLTPNNGYEDKSPILRDTSSLVASSPEQAPTPEPSPPAVRTLATPTLVVSPTVINAGQRVTVTYRGTPGDTLSIWSKTQPATSYSRIASVTLNANGVGTTTHAPSKNTRIMAKSSDDRASAQPLIQVRSVASINVRRVAARTFTFTGTISPALSGRLVNLYRTGVLVAQARTNSSGVYSIRKTLGSGTFNFYVRTANDTYNLGATSRTLRTRIY